MRYRATIRVWAELGPMHSFAMNSAWHMAMSNGYPFSGIAATFTWAKYR